MMGVLKESEHMYDQALQTTGTLLILLIIDLLCDFQEPVILYSIRSSCLLPP